MTLIERDETMPETTEPLTEAHIAEITEAFPHAEYQPTLSPDQVGPCEACKGTIDDHKAGCVVPLIHALIRDWRAMKAERDAAMAVLAPSVPESGLEDACRQLKQAYIAEAGNCETLESQNTAVREQLAQLTSERDAALETLHEWTKAQAIANRKRTL